MAKRPKRIVNPRFSDADLDKLEMSFLTQLPTVAALLAAGAEDYDSVEIAGDALDLVESLLFHLERQEADDSEERER